MNSITSALTNYIQCIPYQKINKIIAPLSLLNISYFLYVKSYLNGRRVWLTNNMDWEKYYFEKEYYRISPFENSFFNYPAKIYLWRNLPGQEMYRDARNLFNIDHGMTLITKFKSGTEFWHFATTPDNADIIDTYLNYTKLFTRFTYYFREKAQQIILDCEAKINHLPPLFNSGIEVQATKDYFQWSLLSQLSHKEILLISQLSQGKSMQEIAATMKLSEKSIESYIRNLKDKFDCCNQFQLGFKFSKYQINS